ncbi:MAG: thioesterase family protein [Schleiferiaceae bacterium]|nr:thioesterase family protein [Schleiferiaceae bacterium]
MKELNPKALSIRWSDIDFMAHLRHSVYYDFAAQQRTEILGAAGIDMRYLQKAGFGPVLFKESCQFLREILFDYPVFISLKVVGLKRDFSQFKIQHHFLGAGDKVHAILDIHGAWIDQRTRKVSAPPQEVVATFEHFPKHEDFQWLD